MVYGHINRIKTSKGGFFMAYVRDVMTSNVEYCSPLDSVFEAAVKMRELNVGAIPICENDYILGMITNHDIVTKCVAEQRSSTARVSDIMSEHLITADPSLRIADAAKLMVKFQIKQLPIVEDSRLIGICSLGELAVREAFDQAESVLSVFSEQPDVHH